MRKKKKIIQGQAGGLAVLEKYGPRYFSEMKKKWWAKRRKLLKSVDKRVDK